MAISFTATRSTQVLTAGGTSISIDVSACTTGKVAVVWVAVANGSTADPGAITMNNSFTKHDEFVETSSPACRVAVFWKKITGSESGVTASWTASAKTCAAVLEYDGVLDTGPLYGTGGGLQETGGTTSVSTAALASSTSTYWPMAGFYQRTTTSGNKAIVWTPDAALTERTDFNNSASGSSPWVGLEVADKNAQVGDTSTHTYTATVGPAGNTHSGGLLVYLVPAAGGTTYTISPTGSVASAGAVTRRAAKSPTGAVTSAGALARRPAKSVAGAMASSGTLTTIRAILRTFTASMASDGTLTRRAGKSTTGATASTGTLSRSTAKALAATVTSSGALTRVKVALITLTAAMASAGVLTRRPGKALAGTLASSGSLTRASVFARSFAGAVTSAGTVSRSTSKLLAGTLTSSATLGRVKVALLALAGSMASSATLGRQPRKALTGALANAGQLTRQPRKAVAGTLTSAGALSRTRAVLLALAGAMSSAGAVTRRTSTTFTATLTSDGGLTRMARLILAGAVTSAGVVATVAGTIATEAWSWYMSRSGVLRKSTALQDGAAPTTTDVT